VKCTERKVGKNPLCNEISQKEKGKKFIIEFNETKAMNFTSSIAPNIFSFTKSKLDKKGKKITEN